MLNFFRSHQIIWIPVLLFLFSFIFPISFVAKGNSSCNTSPIGLDQAGDAYRITNRIAKGCFIKGLDVAYHLSLASEREFVSEIFLSGNKVGVWKIPKGITNIELVSDQTISEIEFRFQHPFPNSGGLFLFQKKTFEYNAYQRVIFILFVVSLLILGFRYGIVRTKPGFHFLLLWLAIYSADFLILKNWEVSVVGDEPHYLLMGESFLEDFDSDLDNQYSFEKKSLFYRKFDHHTIYVEGRERPVHYPLLSAYMSLAFLNRQMDPVLAAKVLLMIMHSLGTAFLFFVIAGRAKYFIEVFLGILTAFGLPWFAYSNQIYPEVPAGILLFGLFYCIYERIPIASTVLFPLAFIAFPFLHIKFAPISVLLFAFWLYRCKPGVRKGILNTGIFLVGFFFFLLYNYLFFKGLSPYGSKDIHLEDIQYRYLAYLFDVDRGLFALNPTLLLFFVALPVWFKKDRVATFFAIALIGIGHLPNLFHTNIWLGTCPFGRYWVAVYPLLAFFAFNGLSEVLDRINEGEEKNFRKYGLYSIIFFLSVLSVFQMISFLFGPENYYTLFDKRDVVGEFILGRFSLDIRGIYYSYFIESTLAHSLYWIGFAVFLFVLGTRIGKERKEIP